MATVGALAIRRAGVQGRLDTAAKALSKRFGIADVGPLGVSQANRDPEIGRLEQLERVAALLEAVLVADKAFVDPKYADGPKAVTKRVPEQTGAVIDPATGEQTATVIEAAERPKARR